jgi:hypothetical protein
MKQFLSVFGIVLMVFLFCGISSAEVYIIDEGMGGGFKTKADPDYAPFEAHGSKGAQIAMLYEIPNSGVQIYRIPMAGKALIGEHNGTDDPALVYILHGYGELVNTDGEGKANATIKFKTGDLIMFHQPQPMHYWTAGPAGCELMYIMFPPKTK